MSSREDQLELTLTVVGRDRPGIGAEVLGALVDGGASIRAAHGGTIAGRFAFTVVVEAPSEPELTAALEEVAERFDLEVGVTPSEGAFLIEEASEQAILSCYGPAEPAVMAELFQVLGRFGVNVEEFRFEQLEGGGKTRLRADLRVRLPQPVDLDTVLADLRELEDRMGLESSLRWDLSFLI